MIYLDLIGVYDIFLYSSFLDLNGFFSFLSGDSSLLDSNSIFLFDGDLPVCLLCQSDEWLAEKKKHFSYMAWFQVI